MTTSKHYPEAEANPDFPKLEERVLARWKKEDIFAASVEQRPAKLDGHDNEFIFYDGPPFANGLPHYGHLLTGFVKDMFARYQTMRGKRVERRFGWDCHGLPAELAAEKELEISGRQAIAKYGIGRFNDYCRTSVMKYTREWEYYVTRQARWVDFRNDYKTMDKGFMESVLWAFKRLYDQGFIYEAYRVMPYSWAAETPVSNFETRLDNSYRERVDKAITVAFEINAREFEKKFNITGAKQKGVFKDYKIIAWTTTPWTLPSNLALAVNKELEYVCLPTEHGAYILSAAAANKLFPEQASASEMITFKGSDLLGLAYKPMFPYFARHPNAFRILDGSGFVTNEDGTGVVHMAPGFGEDDQRACEAAGITLVCPVDGSGRFTDEIFDLPDLSLKGMNVIEENVEKFRFGEANEKIIEWLKKYGLLIKQEQITHNYPHCWRTDRPLIYRAVPSWYVEVTKYRDRMVELNRQINWIPAHIRDGLFGKWLENARDWSISRNRFWGTPIPVWRSPSGKIKVFGSIAEIEQASGKKIVDLHRPAIDDVVISDGGEEYRRVEDVFDCWFESGSMPYAQVHYPFENKEWFETHSPADFITEYMAQTRGWFYTLMAMHAGVFHDHPKLSKTPPFKNCICHGVVIDDETGLKYSKRLKNYKDPKWVFDTFGSDALRWLMLSSPVMRGLDLSVDPDGKFIRDVVRLAIKPIWNAYNFFCLYANADGVEAQIKIDPGTGSIMDRYILIKCSRAVSAIRAALDAYDTPTATDAVTDFFEALNNWYIRRSKERFWREARGQDIDKQAAYDTLFTVLHVMCRASAPLLPLTLDEIYCSLTGGKSVHLDAFPDVSLWEANTHLMQEMDAVRDICNTALAIRNAQNLRVRMPLASLKIMSSAMSFSGAVMEIICDEVNVKTVAYDKELSHYATFKLQIHFPVLGKRLPEKIKQIIPAVKKGQWKQLSDGRIEIAGETLEKNEFSILLEPRPEFKDRAQALSTNDALVILDTDVTEELRIEGYARDLVRLIQQARKDAGLHVTDRIHLRLRVSEALKETLQVHRDYIAEQVLAATVTEGDMMGCTFIRNETIESEEVSIGFTSQAEAA
jgi:isoleucyl-tRNA synthetase